MIPLWCECAQRRIYVNEDVNARMLVCENMRMRGCKCVCECVCSRARKWGLRWNEVRWTGAEVAGAKVCSSPPGYHTDSHFDFLQHRCCNGVSLCKQIGRPISYHPFSTGVWSNCPSYPRQDGCRCLLEALAGPSFCHDHRGHPRWTGM